MSTEQNVPEGVGAGLATENGVVRVDAIHLKTVPHAEYGQHISVSVIVGDKEVEVIRSWGALPDITISHTVTDIGIHAALKDETP